MHLLPRVIIKLLLIAAFPFVLYPLRFYESVELYRIKGAYQKWKNPKKWKDNISNIKIG
jgi:hypothetical protein